jgi:HPt (histidine-containing phosphotransfer) domain-containing protein
MGSGIVNKAVLRDRVGGSHELLEEVAGMYTDERPALLKQLYAALDAGDADGLHRKAHRLKGTFGSLAAEGAVAIAERVSDLACKGNLGRAREELDRLAVEARNVEDELRRIDAQEWGEPLSAG